ncbi:MAG: protein translocase subunit SecD [Jatrophihabitans sp.]
MAPSAGTLRVSRYFLALFLILGLLYLLVALPGHRKTPKLGIDLVGGIRVIFTAQPPKGEPITTTAMEQARQIIEDRINATGVTASTVQIQGDNQLVVSIPGGTDTDVQRLGQATKLNFRPLIAPPVPVSCISAGKGKSGSTPAGTAAPSSAAPSAGASSGSPSSAPSASAVPSGSTGPNGFDQRPLTAPTPSAKPSSAAKVPSASKAPSGTTAPSGSASVTPAPAPSGSASVTPAPAATAQPCVTSPLAEIRKTSKTFVLPRTEAEYTKLPPALQQALTANLSRFDCADAAFTQDDINKDGYIACQDVGGQNLAYLLGSVIVPGDQIDQATPIAPSTGGSGSGLAVWSVQLKLKSKGDSAWGTWTTNHNTNNGNAPSATQCSATAMYPCSDYVAFTLDGKVISAPATNSAIVGLPTQITGNFDQGSATRLSDQLNGGALPLSFRADSNERVSASLGTSQLSAALLAGGIGLILVVIYSLLYYRALGLVTIASLLVSAVLTYAMMVILGEQIGFTLDLAGIAGLIVALGITADSFVVFFERLKDEVHEGRSVRVAVPRAWVRARRTILSADTVSFLAAAILYYFASADVKGFAFTLGLSTILDLVVVFLFTHPVVSLLSRSKAFGSPRFTGLNSVRAGGIALDRDEARVKRSTPVAGKPKAKTTAAGTVVLDKTTDIDTDDEIDSDLEDADATVDEPVAESRAEDDSPRRRTTPGTGTAAERAAARRARQRTKDEGDA